jgi:UDP-2,3-diacylglucosamine hydrolase
MTAADAPLGIVCGSGMVPFAVADAVQRRGRPVVLFPLRGWADAQAVAAYRHNWIAVGQLGRFCRLVKAEGCHEVAVVGGLLRPAIRDIRLDWVTVKRMPLILRAFRGGDNHLLSGIARAVEKSGIRVLAAHEVAPEITAPLGTLGRHRPDAGIEGDIDRGFAVLAAMSPFDVGQAAVVARGRVLAIEAAEGTDGMLDRVAALRENGRIALPRGVGVLVKAPKRRQDRRFDLPSIGPATVAGAAKAGLAGIAVVAGATIMAEPERLIETADRNGLFVIGHRDSEAHP